MNKQGYLRTLEAVFAIVLFLIALFGVLSIQKEKIELKPQDIELMQDTILSEVEYNQIYREEIIDNNIGETRATYNFVKNRLPDRLDFIILSCETINDCNIPEDNPKYQDFQNAEKIYADSIIITDKSNQTYISRLFILYLWHK